MAKRKRLKERQMFMLSVKQEGRCAICFQPLAADDVTQDHIVHFSRGGSNSMRNLRLVHKRCNLQRGTKWS